ncbi:MAG: protein translocase subunit SecD [Candidatus Omnitrophica bacterium]|nr:protein translocase subunit SecD [Candidatus Omnitrophota bacterium]
MNKKLRNKVLIIIGVIIGSLLLTFPPEKHINLGLDLKGGMHLVLRVELEKLDANAKKDAVDRAIEILRNRIDELGGREVVIQKQGVSKILVQIPGVVDRQEAQKLIVGVAQLNFHLVHDDNKMLEQALNNEAIPEGFIFKRLEKEDDEALILEATPAMTGENVTDARVDFNSSGFNEPQISLQFNSKGAKEFAKVTRDNVNRRLAIVLDDTVLSAPNIKEAILGGRGQITGRFSFEEANLLALSLRSGALPAPMKIEEERTVGPLLGKDSIDAGIRATIIAGILVFIFMLVYYRKAGVISDLALAINLLLIFGVMGFFNAMMPDSQLTLTLPGIAGIILTLGMAVDANILINERIREELNSGRPLQTAVSNGFSKALKAIVDSNTTTLIAALMLFIFGSGPIKGFAVTLSIGLAASLFTALFVTRTLFEVLISNKMLKTLPMRSFFDKSNINFISKRWVCFVLSLILVGASVFVFLQKKSDAYGIDFAGGQIQEYRFNKEIPVDSIRQTLKSVGLDEVVIQQFKESPESVMIRSADETDKIVVEAFKKSYPENPFDVLRVELVGPVVGKDLRNKALASIICAVGAILLYVGFRFKHFDFGTAGVIALLHDVIVTTGIIVFMGRQIDLLVVTAMLTIAGYSINDTIIIYDRVRENMVNHQKKRLADIINISINQTLSRTLLTTLTTFIVVVTLFIKGGEVLNTFALCLMVGVLAGTYSTIFIACPLALVWDKKKK